MTTETKELHSPLPWYFKEENDGICAHRISSDRIIIVDVLWHNSVPQIAPPPHTARANTEFIVRAVNNHEALVSALELARLNMIEAQAHGIGMGGAIEKAEQALANAREKE